MEKLLWSIAFPGLGQLLNKKYIKGLLFIFLEFLINVNSHFNQIIMLSFQGKIQEAIQIADYDWLMFYPCVYLFAMWDSVRDAQGEITAYFYLPFVLSAYTTTIGTIYSNNLTLFHVLWGPVWLPILFCFLGLGLGLLLKYGLTRIKKLH
jgi:hypothetical protein